MKTVPSTQGRRQEMVRNVLAVATSTMRSWVSSLRFGDEGWAVELLCKFRMMAIIFYSGCLAG